MPGHRLHRTLSIATAMLAVGLTAVPSSGTAGSWTGLLPASSRASLTAVLETAGELRGDIASGSVASTIRGLLEANGGPPVSNDHASSPAPTTFEAAVDHLDSAVRAAVGRLGTIPVSELDRYVRRVGESYTTFMKESASALPRMPRRPEDGQDPIAARPRYPDAFTPPPAIRRAITHAPAAALLLAAALDRSMPALRASAGAETATGQEAAVCDVRDHRPFLCVSSSADHTYTASDDAALIIDQGGNDTYLNAAAGAPFLPAGGQAYLPVAVLLDQAGNDTYTSARAPWAYGLSAFSYQLLVADAGSIAGSVSLLIDDAGDDVHIDAAPASGGPGKAAMALTQGGTIDGVAALIDRGGSDRYEASSQDGVRDYAALFAQGAGLSFLDPRPQTGPVFAGSGEGAIAALIDRGTADDTYLARSGAITGGGNASVQGAHTFDGQGYVSLGVGVLADEGGSDSIRATGSATRLGISRYPDHTGGWAAPDSTILAQGYGLGPVFGNTTAPKGYAAVLTGAGDTTYEMAIDSTGFAVNQLWGQGFAGGDGAAIVDDQGGNDWYRAASTLTHEPTITVSECGPSTDEDCTRAQATVDLSRLLTTSWMYVQAEGGVTGEAVLHDRSGHDRYDATFLGTTDVLLDDRLATPTAPPKLDVTGYGPTVVLAQGHTGLGESLLLDEAGTDLYVLRNVTDTTADAESARGPGTPDVVATAPTKGATRGQGAGEWFIGSNQVGALLDLGGLGDRFIGVSDNLVTNEVDPDRAYRWGWNWPQGVQGNGFQGVFVANGIQPRIRSTPSQGVCPTSPGFRGFGEWHFCGQQGTDPDHQIYDGIPAFLAPLPNIWAYGRAPNATGGPSSLAFGTGTASDGTAPGVAEVSARLLGPTGVPLAGAPVRFDLQYASAGSIVPDPRFTVFFNYWETTALTDADGVARARLPYRFEFMQPGTYPMRLMASYSGADGIYPAHTTTPFTLTVPPPS